jgi:hypothetical protein
MKKAHLVRRRSHRQKQHRAPRNRQTHSRSLMMLVLNCSRIPINACVSEHSFLWSNEATSKLSKPSPRIRGRINSPASTPSGVSARACVLPRSKRRCSHRFSPTPIPKSSLRPPKCSGDVKTDGKPLIPLLSSKSARVRFHAAIALGKLEEPSQEELLVIAAKEKVPIPSCVMPSSPASPVARANRTSPRM